MTKIHYPSNYTDPHAGPIRAQCTECCKWRDVADLVTIELVPDWEYGEIPQGICRECGEKEG